MEALKAMQEHCRQYLHRCSLQLLLSTSDMVIFSLDKQLRCSFDILALGVCFPALLQGFLGCQLCISGLVHAFAPQCQDWLVREANARSVVIDALWLKLLAPCTRSSDISLPLQSGKHLSAVDRACVFLSGRRELSRVVPHGWHRKGGCAALSSQHRP